MTAVFSVPKVKPQPRRLLRSYAFALAVAVATGISSVAHAQSASDSAQVMETIKKLEARVAALEGDYKRAKQDVAEARAEVRALRHNTAIASATTNKQAPIASGAMPTNTAATLSHATDAPAGLYSMSAKSPRPIDPGWGGLYVGAAFGLDAVHARESFSETDNIVTTDTGLSVTSVDTGTENIRQAYNGQSLGAVSSLSLGYNYVIDSRDVLGAQVEGGLADTHVNLKGSGALTTTTTIVNTPPGGAAGTSGSTNTNSNTTLTDLIENHWLVSALLRGGRLVDSSDYVYLLGGYTYGRFQAEGEGFGLSGGTVGAGWERQVVPGWTLKAEYRYTRFQDKDLLFTNQNRQTQATTGGYLSVQNTSVANDTHFSDLDMHSVWVGVSHYFGSY